VDAGVDAGVGVGAGVCNQSLFITHSCLFPTVQSGIRSESI